MVRDVIANKNSMATKQKRFVYVSNLMNGTVDINKCIFIDESGFNSWIRRTFGRSTVGTRCYKQWPSYRGNNTSLCMAISKEGIIHHKIRNGAFNRNAFQEFMVELEAVVGDEEINFVVDNCSIHYDIYLDYDNHQLIYLPPYSPILNPIETLFSVLKSKIKENIGQKSEIQRHQNLSKIIEDVIMSMRSLDLTSHYRHSMSFHSACINKIDILGG